jgi:hypothetical protein
VRDPQLRIADGQEADDYWGRSHRMTKPFFKSDSRGLPARPSGGTRRRPFVIAEVLGWPQNGVTVDPAKASPLPDGAFAEGEAFIPSDFHQWTRGDGHKQRVAMSMRVFCMPDAPPRSLSWAGIAAAMLSTTSTQRKRSGGAGAPSIPRPDNPGTARSCGSATKTSTFGAPNRAC